VVTDSIPNASNQLGTLPYQIRV